MGNLRGAPRAAGGGRRPPLHAQAQLAQIVVADLDRFERRAVRAVLFDEDLFRSRLADRGATLERRSIS